MEKKEKKRSTTKKKRTAMTKRFQALTLDEIEQKSTELALSMDTSNFFINTKKIEALNMIANQKIQRMKIELSMAEKQGETTKPEPITVEFVSANTVDSQMRIDKLTEEVENSINPGTKNNA